MLRDRSATRYCWGVQTDLWGDAVPEAWQDQCLAVMALTPWHTHLVCTRHRDQLDASLCWHGHDPAPAQACPCRQCAIVRAMVPLLQEQGIAAHDAAFGAAHYLATHWPLPNVWVVTWLTDLQGQRRQPTP